MTTRGEDRAVTRCGGQPVADRTGGRDGRGRCPGHGPLVKGPAPLDGGGLRTAAAESHEVHIEITAMPSPGAPACRLEVRYQ